MRYRILISDDEVDIVEMLTGFFRGKGYEVFSAYNGVETLKLAELQPDIILLDINMPKLDGIEVCKKIRDYVSCPILFLTARIEENDKVQGFSVGGDDYIVKPFSLVELEATFAVHAVNDRDLSAGEFRQQRQAPRIEGYCFSRHHTHPQPKLARHLLQHQLARRLAFMVNRDPNVLHRKVQPVVLRDDEHALQPGFVLWMCLHNATSCPER